MIFYRIDIKKGQIKVPVIYKLLRWVVAVYIIAAFFFLIYMLYYLLVQQQGSKREWFFFILNLLLVVFLSKQFLKIENKKYIVITDDVVKYGQDFPWSTRVKWNNIKQIRIGHSSVTFITHANRKHRFSLARVTTDEIVNLQEALNQIAAKNNIDLVKPFE